MYLFILAVLGLCWFVGFSLSLWRAGATLWLEVRGVSLPWLLLLQSTGSRACGFQQLQRAGSVVVAHRLSCPEACGIFLDQGLNPCLLHWQEDSLPLSHQGIPLSLFKWDSNFSFRFHLRIWKNEERIYQDEIDAFSISQNFRYQWCHVESLLSQESPQTP